MEPKYPNVTVALTGSDGNAFMILGKVGAALKKAGVPAEDREAFARAATSGDYDNLLRTCMEYVNVD